MYFPVLQGATLGLFAYPYVRASNILSVLQGGVASCLFVYFHIIDVLYNPIHSTRSKTGFIRLST